MEIIDDSTPLHVIFPPGKLTGLDLSGRPEGFAYGGTADPFPDELIIPRSEWQARIQEAEETKTRIPDLCDRRGLKVKDQQQTNYCWANAPVHCVEIMRCWNNQRPVPLSPASVAARIKNYQNVGGWGKEALEFIAKNGAAPAEFWPVNAIDRRYATPATLEIAKGFAVDEWYELEPRNLDHMISCLLLGIPVAIGLNWWRHEVTATHAVWIDGEVGVGIDNSWGQGWGDKGRGVLRGSRMYADDAVAPRTVKVNR